MGLARIQRHARLAQHMLVIGQRRDGHGRVHVGPGADADGINIGIPDDFLPISGNTGYAEFVRHPLRGSRAAIYHGHDFDTILGLQARNVQLGGVAAGTDHADTNFLISHWSSLSIS